MPEVSARYLPPESPVLAVAPWPGPSPAPRPSVRLLARHQARVLLPSEAIQAVPRNDDQHLVPVHPTAYRSDVLLMSSDVDTDDFVDFIDEALRPGGRGVTRATAPDDEPGSAVRRLRILAVADSEDAALQPVDAWRCLQRVRLAARQPGNESRVGQVVRLSLEHLLFADTLGGLGAYEGHPDPWEVDDSFGAGDSRSPVDLVIGAPPRRDKAQLGGRRPVIAVLDTGVGIHPWLTEEPRDFNTKHDDFVFRVDPARWGQIPIPDPEANPRQLQKLRGTLDSHAGHGTFIAGLIRQIAPDSRVLALPVMYSDGVVHEGDLVNALGWVRDRVLASRAAGGDPEEFIDIVSLSLGHYHERPDDEVHDSELTRVIGELGDLGVAVVASAGNDATELPCYPAALAAASDPPAVPIISVGARNPNGTRALYSNEGDWVTDWALGSAVVSTFPAGFFGSASPANTVNPAVPANSFPELQSDEVKRERIRQGLDPDDYTAGFGRWSGTSFAAPILAAHLALQLVGQQNKDIAVALEQYRQSEKARYRNRHR